jgi:hypothetical protein
MNWWTLALNFEKGYVAIAANDQRATSKAIFSKACALIRSLRPDHPMQLHLYLCLGLAICAIL